MAPTRRKFGGKKKKNTIKYTWGIHSLTRKRMKTHRKKKRSHKRNKSRRRRKSRGRRRKGGSTDPMDTNGDGHDERERRQHAADLVRLMRRLVDAQQEVANCQLRLRLLQPPQQVQE
jgi:hypothetical protein